MGRAGPLVLWRRLARRFALRRGPRVDFLTGPIRDELLGAEGLAEHARTLASRQRLRTPSRPRAAPLLRRLDATLDVLVEAHARIASDSGSMDIGPAGEWLLDNFYVVREHVIEVREGLPRGYYRELPELASGLLAGYPRVYELAIALISHTEGRIDRENLEVFLGAFQQLVPLSIGELWALPAMLRLGLVENIRRITLRTVNRLDQMAEADAWAGRIHEADSGPTGLAPVLEDFETSHPRLTADFVARLHQQIRLLSDTVTAVTWLEHWLEEQGQTAEEAIAHSTQRRALTQVVMANSITSLRTLAGMNWRSFVEEQSALDAVLRTDPAGVYARMTFETRDQYRHAVERLAKRTRSGEEQIAHRAIELAREATTGTEEDARRTHVGWQLIAEGLPTLERALGYRPTLREHLFRWVLRHPMISLGLGAFAGTVAALAALLWLAGGEARASWLLVLLLGMLPANEIALNVIQQLVTTFVAPRRLPKLDFIEQGVPPEYRTAVVIPTLFGSVGGVERALETLEVQFLANREAHLHFVVLSDFTDAPTETRDTDAAIVAAAVEGVRSLNARYGAGANDVFYLLHRPRRWNPRQGVWMGWERKRGKLTDLNRLIVESNRDAFSVVEGDLPTLQSVRYVITLDSDTVLPPDAAPLLVGALAHPLNRALFDPARGRVTRGYGILQPRVGISLPSANRTLFASIYSGRPGVDPYTTAVSDLYQDLHHEGSFTGKGIYDVAAFERATRGRFPENAVLSHDLIEGAFARAGLATDIQVFDDYPSRYLTWTRRKHRWIRGDWQLLRWLLPTVPGPNGPERNPLSLLSKWKLVDNLRRSLLEIAQLSFLVAGWILLPGSRLRWTVLALLAIAAPWLVTLLLGLVRPPLDRSWRAYYGAVAEDTLTSVKQLFLAVVFLPHQAWISADAIVRTLWRLGVSRVHLLEWQTASQVERVEAASWQDAWRAMWPAVTFSVLLLPAASRWHFLSFAVPLVALWLFAPGIAHRLGDSPVHRERRMAPALRKDALRYALLHWNFFDRFVTAATHWLAPDNFQETPVPVVAMRTSPTNIGLQLLATTSAYDLGFLPLEELLTRLERVFSSLERLRRFRGHFYNWYGLHDLQDLVPAYVSTVDSGNLAGHLIALRQACLTIPDEPVFDRRVWRAADTALGLVESELAGSTVAPKVHQARVALVEAERSLDAEGALGAALEQLQAARDALAASPGSANPREDASEWMAWTARLLAHSRLQLSGLTPRFGSGRSGETTPVFPTLRELARSSPRAGGLIDRLEVLAATASRYVAEMDFSCLYDEQRSLFAIGYQLASHALDSSHYDLLASEARLASFVAIAKNDVPVDHWFHLGREISRAAGGTALMSWSGTMFEYLMPLLVMRSFPFTLLDQTYRGAVRRHLAYGTSRGVPWGTSESAYNLRDRSYTYQYRTFGVPDLALKRGLDADLVIAPYASALATMVEPARALVNLRALEKKGALGRYGFRDALDYTRPDPGHRYAVVETYMAHHIGMGLVALANALTAKRWQRRFHADPLVRAAELLLYERTPRRVSLQEPQASRVEAALPSPGLEQPAVREFDTPNTLEPRVALLGQLPYTIMVTNGGSGYARYEDLAVTRWRADGTTDATGQFCYLKDVRRRRVWSSAHQPVCAPADAYHVALATDRVVFHRTDGAIETRTEITVVPDDAAEVRRVSVTNNGSEAAEVELTSYGEVVLAPPDADRAHPAFGNLFVETEWHDWCHALMASRRPRSAGERRVWCMHVVASGEERVGPISYETDRSRFIGRGRSLRDPAALDEGGVLSGTTGAVIDPIFALRTRLRLEPGRSTAVAFTTLVAATRERAFELADRYRDPRSAQRALDLAWTAAQIELRELNTSSEDAAVFQRLAGALFFSEARLRAPEAELVSNQGSQPLLWAIGISGDWPILLANIDSVEGLATLRQLMSAHRYWRRRGMMVDLVILNLHPPTYVQELTQRITAAVVSSSDAGLQEKPGGIFIRRRELLGPAELQVLRATARVHVTCDGRPLDRILDAVERQAELLEVRPPPRGPIHRTVAGLVERLRVPVLSAGQATLPPPRRHRLPAGRPPAAGPRPGPPLLLDNGLGGLAADGSYEIRLDRSEVPPAPWANVIANETGGFLVTERGGGFSWAGNSFFYRLTPWHNDPVTDPLGDVLYLRDETSGDLWSPTPGPIQHPTPYTIRHGAGVSSFAHRHTDVETELTLSLWDGVPVKQARLRVTNHGSTARRLGVTSYVEWTLGSQREHTQHQVRTDFDASRNAIFAQNTFDPQFASWVAFSALSVPVARHTGDRREFLGRHGSVEDPAGLRGVLSGRTGAALDPCAALQCTLEIGPGESKEITVVLGAAPSREEARGRVDAARTAQLGAALVDRTLASWKDRLSVVRVRTPEPAFDAMINHWLLYQSLSCRMWGRSGLYQSSGAYGFRDQLQDSMAFVYAAPDIARQHVLRAASRQFVEGDVQHWWHPESGRGVRTRSSDDLAWLPYVVDHYLQVTGDAGVLDVSVPFLTMRTLEPDEHEIYDLPQISETAGTLYEHCIRALDRASTLGAHGLPLIGIGDWNDGLNRVGVEGRGESVWLAWFLIVTLRGFAAQADVRGESATAARLRERADAYLAAVEQHGWDGAWYRRAYFDDGTPLGSASNEECRIDSIAQSWSVISGAASPERQAQAMRSLEEHLIDPEHRILSLLTPPFDRAPVDPGYIKGYLPGVRENGAQYTHASLWAVLATALSGDGDHAFELFQMLNPLTHARTPGEVATYKVEPYVVAADVYTAAGHVGRGGWTWYTGSASWMYRIGLEAILGFEKRGDTLRIRPSVPVAWPEYAIDYRFGRSVYAIVVRSPGRGGKTVITLDGWLLQSPAIPLVDDGARHEVRIDRGG